MKTGPGKKKHAKNDLTQGVVWKSLLIFFLPIAAGTCIQQLYNAVDGLIVGRFVGTAALAAVGGSSAQIINLLIGFFVAATAGASVIIAQIYGAGRGKDVARAAGNAFTMFAILGVALMLIGLAGARVMLTILKTPSETIPGALLYLRIYFIGVPFILVLNMESNMLRAVGDSFGPFLYMVAGCLTNIVLDVVFVVVFQWGIAGVSIATVLSQVLNMVLLTIRLWRTQEEYRLTLSCLGFHGGYIRKMLQLGVPSGLQSSMYAVSNMIIQVAVNSLGTLVVASWAMTSKTDGIFWAVSNALGAAITSFIGQNYGAGRQDRVKQCLVQGLILAEIITIVICTLLLAFGIPLLQVLTNDPEVVRTTYKMMTYFVPAYVLWAVIEVLSAILRGSGDTLRPFLIVSLGICAVRILWILTAFQIRHTLFVLCLCYAVSWAITSVALVIYYRKGTWMDPGRRVMDH